MAARTLQYGKYAFLSFMTRLFFFLMMMMLGNTPTRVAGFASFSPSTKEVACQRRDSLRCCRSSSSLRMSNNMFDSVREFFDQFGDNDDDDDKVSDELPAGTQRIVTIPVESIKPGGLRLFLMFYLMGQQNTPERGSWRADQPSTEEYVVDFFFHDQSALLSVNLLDHEIVINRVGTSPSNAYIMHESVIIQGILSELDQCAFDEGVEESNRLLILKEPKDAIEKARESLAFG